MPTLSDYLAGIEPTSVAARNRADLSRRQFSVLCWRGWCDNAFKCRDIARMTAVFTGEQEQLPDSLPRRECPSPKTCQCVCHDAEREAGAT